MNITLYLLTAHFLADYPLQTSWVAKAKQKGYKGLLAHTFTHLLVTTLVLFPFWHSPRVWWGVLIVFATHTLIDHLKIEESKHLKVNPFLAYVIDQLLHYLIIFLVATYFVGSVEPDFLYDFTPLYLYLSPLAHVFIIFLILATYYYDISRWIYQGGPKKRAYKRNYKLIIRNSIIVTILFGGYLFYLLNYLHGAKAFYWGGLLFLLGVK